MGAEFEVGQWDLSGDVAGNDVEPELADELVNEAGVGQQDVDGPVA